MTEVIVMSTWLLLAIILAALVLFFTWASRRYRRNRANAPWDSPDSVGDQHRRTGGYAAGPG
jgi:hypothetical protein